jgi:tetratricopeptide (TPR) repeat protein
MEALSQQGQDVLDWAGWVESRLGQAEPISTSQTAVLGSIYQRLEGGDRDVSRRKALAYYERAIAAYRRANSLAGVAVLLNNMGLLYCELARADRAQYRRAIPLFEEALEYYEEVDEPSHRGAICLSLAEAYAKLDEAGADHFELAREFYERAWALAERSGEPLVQAMAQGGLGDTQVELASFGGAECLEKAVRHFRNALSIYVDLNDIAAQAHYQERLGYTYGQWREEEHLRKALRAYERAGADYIQCQNSLQTAQVKIELARIAIALDEWETAFAAASQALQLFSQLEMDDGRARSFQVLASIYLSAGDESAREDIEQAERCLLEAQRLFLREQMAEEYGCVASELRQVQNLIRGVQH